ncbi:MAG: hypothetical protein COB66_01640 [Coxiella sp. (in: Bacteria)]|nr:MAG: hypothetical protein COB66_01640 [Coxiella sp. (in: g-proteobacteria)]
MNSLMYFLCGVVLLLGMMYLGGYIGHVNAEREFTQTSNMEKLVSGNPSDGSGGCTSCKWY